MIRLDVYCQVARCEYELIMPLSFEVTTKSLTRTVIASSCWRCEITRQVLPRRISPFLLAKPSPESAYPIEVLFDDDEVVCFAGPDCCQLQLRIALTCGSDLCGCFNGPPWEFACGGGFLRKGERKGRRFPGKQLVSGRRLPGGTGQRPIPWRQLGEVI